MESVVVRNAEVSDWWKIQRTPMLRYSNAMRSPKAENRGDKRAKNLRKHLSVEGRRKTSGNKKQSYSKDGDLIPEVKKRETFSL